MDYGYVGIMIWVFDQDDFIGYFCKVGKYFLLLVINKILNEYILFIEILIGQCDIFQVIEDYGGIINWIVDLIFLSFIGLILRYL